MERRIRFIYPRRSRTSTTLPKVPSPSVRRISSNKKHILIIYTKKKISYLESDFNLVDWYIIIVLSNSHRQKEGYI